MSENVENQALLEETRDDLDGRFLLFHINDRLYSLMLRYVIEIIPMQNITYLPGIAYYIKGVINLRGEVIPVMSARIKMNLEEDVETKATRIIILKLDQHDCIGILVDEVKEVVNLEEGQIDKVSYEAKEDKSNFIYGIGKYEGGLISLLDVNLVISGAETI